MGLFDQLASIFRTPSHHIIQDPRTSGGQFVEHRFSDPDHPVYERPTNLLTTVGSSYDEVTEEQQRTAYRGIISRMVRQRASVISKAMCAAQVKRKTGEKEYEDVEPDHPWRTLLLNPCPNMSAFDLWYDVSQMRDLSRGAFLWTGRNALGVIDSLYPIYPFFGRVHPLPDTTGGVGAFRYEPQGGGVEEIPKENAIWIHHRNPVTPYEGASLLQAARFESDIDLYQKIYGRDTTAEGNVPAVYASSKQQISRGQSEEFGKRLQAEYFRAGNKKKALVLGSDTKLERIGVSPDDLQYVEAAGLNKNDLIIIFGFSPAMFAEGGVVANSKELRRGWLQDSIQHDVNAICASVEHQFKVGFDAMDSDLCIVPPDVVPQDELERQRVREIKVRTGQATPNEFRMEDGLDEYAGGEKYYLSAGLTPVNEEDPADQESVPVDE